MKAYWVIIEDRCIEEIVSTKRSVIDLLSHYCQLPKYKIAKCINARNDSVFTYNGRLYKSYYGSYR